MINWNAFFVNRYNTRLLKQFATGKITVRELALGVNTNSARTAAYQVEAWLGTMYGRRLARKAIARRARNLVYSYV